MFDIFGIRARRKAKKEAEEKARLEELAIKKKEYQERKAKIDAFLEDYNEKIRNEACREYEIIQKLAEEQNSNCPKCGSNNIVNHIRRTKGEIHGKGHSCLINSSSHFLFSSNSQFLSENNIKIDGELDTLPVNKCNDCGHEWETAKVEYPDTYNEFSNYETNRPRYLYNSIEEYVEMKYDPEDIKDEFNSLKEKQDAYCIEQRERGVWNFYRTLPKYMLDYALFKGIDKYYYDRVEVEGSDFWGVYKDTDSYSYQMPPKLWEICKKVIGWKGPAFKQE